VKDRKIMSDEIISDL